jgi:Zn-finger nucleic acid-binding protein
MKCPFCADIDLAMAERLGIAIDQCPKCHGIWLKPEQLDRFVERSVARPTELQIRRAPLPDHSVPKGSFPAQLRFSRR